MDKERLIEKYNVPAPRYTSYPTVPFWNMESPAFEKWAEVIKKTFDESNAAKGISIYAHLPYCEKLCTYCACNRTITKDHALEYPYIKSLLKEWGIYRQIMGSAPVIKEIHLGGGTPTFFSAKNLRWLIEEIIKDSVIPEDAEFSFEAHPNFTTEEQLHVLFKTGFRRVSFGVQDFDPVVQKTINRIQPFEKVKEIMDAAHKIGYQSVNTDLVYGLPKQTENSVIQTMNYIRELKPDRIALYSYAHVPWMQKAQKIFKPEDIPDGKEKRLLYEKSKELLLEQGYREIGMDHFALSGDKLFEAKEKGFLHRNFMGYNTNPTDLLIGLGSTSITDAKYAYAQNTKSIGQYQKYSGEGKFCHERSFFLNDEDLRLKKVILNISCYGYSNWDETFFESLPGAAREELAIMRNEGIIEFDSRQISLTEEGKPFLRNVCAVFDQYLRNKTREGKFSKAI